MATQTLDEKGNVVVDGMNTNVTPSQFQAISTNAFTPTKPLSIPQPQPQDVSGIVGQEIANIGALQTKYDTANTQASDIYSQLAGLSTQNKESDLATAYQTGGVNDAASKIRQLNAQAQALDLEAQAVPLQVQQESIGRGRTEAGIAPLQTARLRENALKALSLGQQAALAQADYQTAKDKADQMITIKYADIENQINTKKLQLDALDRFVLTPTQERLKEARALALKKEERDTAEKKASEIAISDMIIQATPNAPTNVIANAKKIAEQGGSKLAVAQALGVYGGDYLGNEVKKAQLYKLGLENKKAIQELYDKANTGSLKTLSYEENAKFNSTPEVKNINAANAYARAISEYKDAINKYGTGEWFGRGSGALGQAYSALVGATKDYYTLGTLDNGVQKLIALGIPEPGVVGLKANRIGALDEALSQASQTLKANIDQLSSTSYKNTNEFKNLVDTSSGVLMNRMTNEELLGSIPGASGSMNNNTSTNQSFFNR